MPFRHAVERYTLGIAFYSSSILCNATSTVMGYSHSHVIRLRPHELGPARLAPV
jgi:hypothetical protein